MTRLLSAPWFLAVMALGVMLCTQFVAFKMYWQELFPKPKDVLVIKREDPSPLKWSFTSEEILELELELKNRLKQVDEKEQELLAFEARLEADELEINEIKRNVELMRESLLKDVLRLEKSEEKNLKNLSKTYSGMDPNDTVSVFETMDTPTVAKIMYFMKSDKQGDILAVMAKGGEQDVERAVQLTNMLRLFSNEQDPMMQ